MREPAASLLRSIGVGASVDEILSSFKLAYGVVFSFDELMRNFLNVHQFATESVTNYVIKVGESFCIVERQLS